jgi:thiosulfate reductase cytochrome b subunit
MFPSLSLQTAWTGWLVALLVALQAALPYALRKCARQKPQPVPTNQATRTSPNLQNLSPPVVGNSMRWHYLLGFILPAGALAHAWIPMASGPMPRTSMTGLWLATGALGLLFLQLLVGLALKRVSAARAGNTPSRAGLGRVHFAVMLAIGALVLAHMLLNRA